MKKKTTPLFLFAVLCILPCSEAAIDFIYAVKEKSFQQFENEQAVTPREWSFGIGAAGDDELTAASVSFPGSGGVVALSGEDGEFDYEGDDFSSKEGLDAAFQNGAVSLSVTDGGSVLNLGPFDVSGDGYPSAPHLTNALELSNHDVSEEFTLMWDAFVNPGTEGRIVLEIWDESSEGGEVVFEFLDESATSFVIPANAMAVDKYYEVSLLFVNETDGLSSPETIIGYISGTTFLLSTHTSDTELSFFKWQRNVQTAEGVVEEDGYRAFAQVEGVSNTITNAGLNVYDFYVGLVQSLAEPNLYTLLGPWDSKAVLDAAYPAGTYGFPVNENGESVYYGSYELPGDAYPAPPQILGFSSFQGVDASQAKVISWGDVPDGVTFVNVLVFSESSAVEWSTTLEPAATSVELPADTLEANVGYRLMVRFASRLAGSSKPVASLGYVSSTYLDFQTSNGNGGDSGIEFIYTIKEKAFEQTGNAAATTPVEWSFGAGVSGGNDVLGGTLNYPGGSVAFTGSAGNYEAEDLRFASQQLLDAAYPSGDYSVSVTLSGGDEVFGPGSISGDAYPDAPHMLNLEALSNHDFAEDFVLNWVAFSGSKEGDRILFQIWSSSSDGELVFEFLDRADTSYTIPGGTLELNKEYEIQLYFINQTATLSGAEAIFGYLSTTRFELSTWVSDYVEWLPQFFDEQELLDELIVGEDADPDGDGFSNRFEFLARLDPTDANSSLDYSFEMDVLQVGPLFEGVNWTINVSEDLVDWSPIGDDLYQRDGDWVSVRLADFEADVFFQLELGPVE